MNEKPTYEQLERRVKELENRDKNRKISGIENELSVSNTLLKCHIKYIEGADRHQIFNGLLSALLDYTSSEFGYIGEVYFEDDGTPYQLSRAITNISWDEESLKYHEENWQDGLVFRSDNTLYGMVIKTGQVVTANDVPNDPRSKGAPEGHPHVASFLGVPIKYKGAVIGSFGLANRDGGYDSELVCELEPFVSTCSVILSALKASDEQKSLLSALEKSEEEYRRLFDNLQEGIWVIDKDAYTAFVNPCMAEMLGYAQKEMVGMHLFEFMDENDVAHANTLLNRRQNGIKEQHQFQFSRKNGEKLYVLIETTPLYDGNGNYDGAIASIMDITGLKHTEEALKAERYKLTEYFENLPMLAYNISFDGVIEDLNNVAVRILCYDDKTELIGRPLIPTVYAPESQEKAKQLFEKWKSKKKIKNEEMQIMTKRGEKIDVLLNADTIFDHNGAPVHSLSTHLDISELKKAEKKVKEYSDHLEELVTKRTRELKRIQNKLIRQEKLAVLGQLAGGVGHELRNPLGAIKNAAYYLNLVLEEPEAETRDTLEILNREVNNAEKIIQGLFDYADPKQPALRIGVDLNDRIQQVLSYLDIPPNIEIQRELNEHPTAVNGDPDQLDQVIRNLLRNAVQAMRDGGALTVRSGVLKDGSIEIQVSDTGVGIPKENLDKIFEPLFTTKAKGIGLGLALCKNHIEAHGGTIEVKSEEGKGTTFTFRLPCSTK